MAIQARNPAAVKLLLGWVGVAAATLGGLVLLGFTSVLIPACGGLLAQGVAAMMLAKRGRERLGWIVLLAPSGALLALLGVLSVAARSGA